jgi:hypothetical protein
MAARKSAALDERRRELAPGQAQQRRPLGGGHDEVPVTELDDVAVRPQAADRHPRLVARRECELRSPRQVVDDRGEQFQRSPRPDRLDVVEHEDEGTRPPLEQSRHNLEQVGVLRPRGRELLDQGMIDGLDLVQHRGDRVKQPAGIVVVFPDGQPREGPGVLGGPLAQDRRLAVSARCDDEGEG